MTTEMTKLTGVSMNKLAGQTVTKAIPPAAPGDLTARVKRATAIIEASKAADHIDELGKLADDLRAHNALEAIKMTPGIRGDKNAMKALRDRCLGES